MQKLGEIFRKVRESKGLKLKDFSEEGLSTSHLSRFENGESEITVSKFLSALNKLKISLDEFMYIVNDFHCDEVSELVHEIQNCIFNNDAIKLNSLLIEEVESPSKERRFHYLNIILIKIHLQEITGKKCYSTADLNYLTDYLFSIDYWGYYELLLFINTIDVLSISSLIILSKEMIKRSDFYSDVPKNRQLISCLALNTYIVCILRGKLLDACYFEKKLKSFNFDETELYERLIFRYAQYLYNYRQNKDKKSLFEIKKIIAALKLAGCYGMADKYENYLKKVMSIQN